MSNRDPNFIPRKLELLTILFAPGVMCSYLSSRRERPSNQFPTFITEMTAFSQEDARSGLGFARRESNADVLHWGRRHCRVQVKSDHLSLHVHRGMTNLHVVTSSLFGNDRLARACRYISVMTEPTASSLNNAPGHRLHPCRCIRSAISNDPSQLCPVPPADTGC
jgi:hypothetical protein